MGHIFHHEGPGQAVGFDAALQAFRTIQEHLKDDCEQSELFFGQKLDKRGLVEIVPPFLHMVKQWKQRVMVNEFRLLPGQNDFAYLYKSFKEVKRVDASVHQLQITAIDDLHDFLLPSYGKPMILRYRRSSRPQEMESAMVAKNIRLLIGIPGT